MENLPRSMGLEPRRRQRCVSLCSFVHAEVDLWGLSRLLRWTCWEDRRTSGVEELRRERHRRRLRRIRLVISRAARAGSGEHREASRTLSRTYGSERVRGEVGGEVVIRLRDFHTLTSFTRCLENLLFNFCLRLRHLLSQVDCSTTPSHRVTAPPCRLRSQKPHSTAIASTSCTTSLPVPPPSFPPSSYNTRCLMSSARGPRFLNRHLSLSSRSSV